MGGEFVGVGILSLSERPLSYETERLELPRQQNGCRVDGRMECLPSAVIRRQERQERQEVLGCAWWCMKWKKEGGNLLGREGWELNSRANTGAVTTEVYFRARRCGTIGIRTPSIIGHTLGLRRAARTKETILQLHQARG